MSAKCTNQKSKRKPQKTRTQVSSRTPVNSGDLARLEFFRHGFALMPAYTDHYPAIAYAVDAREGRTGHYFCSCLASGKKTCDHLKTLSRTIAAFRNQWPRDDPADAFRNSFWHRLGAILADGCRETPQTVQLMTAGAGDSSKLMVADRTGTPMLVYLCEDGNRTRLIERCSPSGGRSDVPTRADVLQQLASLTLTENEMVLADKGLKTVRQTLEGKFWHRFAYHAFIEFGASGCRLRAAVEDADGEFVLGGSDEEDRMLFYIPVPRAKVKRILIELKDALTNQHGLQIQPLSLDAVFDIKLNEGLDLEIRPMLRLIQQNGEARFFKREDLKKYQYGDLYYIKELGLLVEDQYPAAPPRFSEPVRTIIQRSRVPQFLADHADDLRHEMVALDERVRQIRIMSDYDRIEISPRALDREWCWLSVLYSDGSQTISLADIVRAKQAGQRFVSADGGWVDCNAAAFESLDELAGRARTDGRGDRTDDVRLSRADILKLDALIRQPFQLSGDLSHIEPFKYLLDLKPLTPMPVLQGMTTLRGYQEKGVQWLWFLHENHFGGLLCDDMGLGKTHQVMALMVALREARKTVKPFLVVCPTSVLSHWERKIGQHATTLRAAVYYGGQRDLVQTMQDADVLITSYGIMRRDVDALAATSFGVIVLDEMQHIKNAETQTYKAAMGLEGEMKIGVTGTPIENHLDELKALLDICVPGYLGPDDRFRTYYQLPIEEEAHSGRRKELSRLIRPFTLRRLKKTVLQELPAKIEDLRSCRLSEEQVKLYRDAVERNAPELRAALAQDAAPVPYIHIFA